MPRSVCCSASGSATPLRTNAANRSASSQASSASSSTSPALARASRDVSRSYSAASMKMRSLWAAHLGAYSSSRASIASVVSDDFTP